jgi:hypothetical protein
MKKSKIILLSASLILSCIFISGCYSEKQCVKHCSECLKTNSVKETDSVSVSSDSSRKEISHKTDTVLVPYAIPGPIQYLENPCAALCDSIGNLKAYDRTEHKNGLTNRLFTRNDSLIDDCSADSILAIKDRIENELKITNRIYDSKLKETIKTIELGKKSNWDLWLEATYKYSAWFLYLCILGMIIFLIIYWYLHRGNVLRKVF